MNYSVGTIEGVCVSLSLRVHVYVCDESEIIVDHNHKEKGLSLCTFMSPGY